MKGENKLSHLNPFIFFFFLEFVVGFLFHDTFHEFFSQYANKNETKRGKKKEFISCCVKRRWFCVRCALSSVLLRTFYSFPLFFLLLLVSFLHSLACHLNERLNLIFWCGRVKAYENYLYLSNVKFYLIIGNAVPWQKKVMKRKDPLQKAEYIYTYKTRSERRWISEITFFC